MKQKLIIQIITKYLFLMFLTLKAMVFVYESITPLLESAKTSYTIDIDDDFEEEDFEKELEEKTEVNESELFVSFNFNFKVYTPKSTKVTHFFVVKTYREQHLEFTTPPPELLV